jgi:hypothetical protein
MEVNHMADTAHRVKRRPPMAAWSREDRSWDWREALEERTARSERAATLMTALARPTLRPSN